MFNALGAEDDDALKNDAGWMDIWRGDLAAFFSQPTPRQVPEALAQMAVRYEELPTL